jgi:hypothetical protein
LDGTLLAWGANEGGQLGNGATTSRLIPVQVSDLGSGSGVTAVGGGFSHTLALKSDGTVLAWGANSNGQLGDGTTAKRLTPVQTSGLGIGSEVAVVSAGGFHSLALQSNGTVLAWGANANGQLGDGTVYTKNLTPSHVLYDAPFAVEIHASLHTVNIGGGASMVEGLSGAEIRVFDRNDPDFQAVAGGKNPHGSIYGVIFEADAGRVSACETGSDGSCFACEGTIGEVLILMKFIDQATGFTVYVGDPIDAGDFMDTDGDGIPDLATQDLQVLKVLKEGVFQEYRGGSKIVVSGSE